MAIRPIGRLGYTTTVHSTNYFRARRLATGVTGDSMRKLIVLLIVDVLLLTGCSSIQTKSSSADQDIADAFANQQSGLAVSDLGVVDRVLSDDTEGGRHQRFILR